MRPLGHKQEVVLFLGAILVPSAVLVTLSFRMLAQERELAQKRRADQHQQTLAQVRTGLLVRLERIKADQAIAAKDADLNHPARYRDPAVALVARVEDKRVVLPWEADQAADQFRAFLSDGPFAGKIRQAEHSEFAGERREGADSLYREALALARHPAQAAYARLLRARALDRAGRREDALAQFAELCRSPTRLSDEEGVPIRLYAAERLLQAGAGHSAVLESAGQVLAERVWPSPVALHLLSDLSRGVMQVSREPRGVEAARSLYEQVALRIRRTAQAQALQQDFPRLGLLPSEPKNSGGIWVPYGEEIWLVNAAEPRLLVAVRAAEVLASLEAARSRPSGLRLLASLDREGDLLGANFPGLKLAVASGAEDAELVRREQWQRRLYYAALGLVMGATIFGAYLLWRDLRREVRLADLRAQFVSSVSHELRTPLTTIRMLAEGLQMKRPRSVQKQEEYLETIVNESERLTRLVEDLLQFSRIEQERTTYHFRPTALPEVVDAVVRAVQYPLRQRGLELRVALENGLPPLPVDRDALEQALLNLLTNAVKYAGDSRQIELRLRRQDGRAVLEVEDHGVGIAPEHQGRIFEKFYRAPTRENQLLPGAGIGLALVAEIVKAHRGQVQVKSAPGAGSTFSICLPLEQAA